jgi:predicted porin
MRLVEERMMGKLARITALAVAVLLHPAAAQSHETGASRFTLNGFGTVGVVHSDEAQADFVANQLAPDGAGYTRAWSPEVDSRFGLQLTADLTPRLTGILQLIAEQRYDDSYTPTVEWANLRYDLTPDLSVRAGRMVQPSFMVSEYRKVGYATPWVRPPEEVYRLVPVTNFDGIDLSYRAHFDGFTNTLRGSYGRTEATSPNGGESEARGAVTLADTLEWGAATLFASYSHTRLTIDEENLTALFDAFRQFGPEGVAIAERYDADDKRLKVMAVGARYDPGDWFVMGERAHTDSRTFFGDSRGWYLTGGYRFGAVTPYLTVARVRVDSSTSDPGLSLGGLPPPLAAQATALNAALNGLLGSAAQQKSVALGARWDFTHNAALKVQYDRIELDDGSPGVLTNLQPGFEPGGQVNLFSVTLDFVF